MGRSVYPAEYLAFSFLSLTILDDPQSGNTSDPPKFFHIAFQG